VYLHETDDQDSQGNEDNQGNQDNACKTKDHQND
jgi:hypothetical protein